MCIGNVDNGPEGKCKIVTGSMQGTIRIFYPKQKDYQIEDSILEKSLDDPILQLEIGHFISDEPLLALAVLHPRKLVVYRVEAKGGVGTNANYHELVRAYEHKLGVRGLHFTACNMTVGHFGGADRDMIAVQSMDGQIAIYEQEHFAFNRQLPNVLLPGPLCYLPRTDTFVTCDSTMKVICYKYHALAAAASARDVKDNEEGKIGAAANVKKIQINWECNIGEYAYEIASARFTSAVKVGVNEILVLGEHTIFVLRETDGELVSQKRMEFEATVMCPYLRPGATKKNASKDNMILASNTGHIMIYDDKRLLWSARLGTQINCPIVHVEVAQFGDLPGLIAMMDDQGTIAISYLGTDPPNTKVGANETKELDYDKMDEEHRRLLTIIRDSKQEGSRDTSERVLLRVQIPGLMEVTRDGIDDDFHHEGKLARTSDGNNLQLTVRLYVSYTGKAGLQNVNVSVMAPEGIICRNRSFLLDKLVANSHTPVIIPLVFYPSADRIPNNLGASVVAAYTTPTGEPRTAIVEVQLPVCMSCMVSPPIKQSTFKFTLNTNRMPPNLVRLFGDMLTQPGVLEEHRKIIKQTTTNVVSFKYYNGIDCTILGSKNAGRLRVQSSTLHALLVVSLELVRRLQQYFQDDNDDSAEPFSIQYQEPLPLADFFVCIDQHFEARTKLLEVNTKLENRAHQFRIIQKRLLVRFKDRNSSPLGHLDTLMRGTFNKMIDLGNEVEQCQKNLVAKASRLSTVTCLMLMLMRYRFGLDDENYTILEGHLSPIIDDLDSGEQGWEERTDAAMTHLLRTCLAKNAKESASVPAPLKMLKSTTKFKKHITIVCDRLGKGARLVTKAPSKKGADSKKNVVVADAKVKAKAAAAADAEPSKE